MTGFLFFNMSVIVSVYKRDLENHKDLSHQLTGLSTQINELEEACVYLPAPGKLMEFIRLLDAYRVTYGIHSDTEPSFE